MLGEVLRVLEHSRDGVCVSVAEAGRIWIDPELRQYRDEITSPDVFFKVPVGAAEVVHETASDGAGAPRPIDELLYRTAYHGADGALLDRCQPYDVIELKYWPNFTRLPHTRHMITLCSLLSRRPTSLSFAYRMLKIPEADALRFCSAVNAAGYTKVVSSQPASDAAGPGNPSADLNASGASGSFWSRLFDRIAGL
ncbi:MULTISPECIES: hypothetical protein [unclassified Wenzhouxiangella]|uniref:hypothetical protein n=1 Tax=unclassified Wenzhouxiangella TaxID=2613841 RepID=UPI000E32C4F4|nr:MULTISPECIES: hypothetical protein [unclassified Wenzhouxiangella]RFF26441.1 hypothetical protein DZK25_13730 [Wenzhouxiangella sp. 15181]RFP67286.1 hypothetical protein DZK26_12700 [Wenzhouxiangella sp. 15190]